MSAVQQLTQAVLRWAKVRGLPRPRNPMDMKSLIQRWAIENTSQTTPDSTWAPPGDTRAAFHEMNDPVQQLLSNGVTTDIVEHRRDNPNEIDDFDELVDQRNEAMEQAGGDDLHRDYIVAQNDKNALRASAQFVRTQPQTLIGGVLGSSASVSPGASPVQVAAWVGENEETTPVAVVFGPVRNQVPAGLQQFKYRPFGVVQFGTRGSLLTAEVDIGIGVQFTVPGNSVNLAVASESTALLNQELAGALSPNREVPHGPALTRTRYIDGLLASNSTATIVIPQFGRRVWIQRSDSTVKVTLTLFDQTGAGIYDFVVAANAWQSDALILSGDLVSCQLANNDGAKNINARLIFELAF